MGSLVRAQAGEQSRPFWAAFFVFSPNAYSSFMYYIYFLYSKQASKYYLGHSSNPWERLRQHQSNSGEKFTGSYKDWALVGVFEVSENKGDADKIEKFIKRQKSKVLIEKILHPDFVGSGVLALLVRVPHVRD
jgi:putative endonuclease